MTSLPHMTQRIGLAATLLLTIGLSQPAVSLAASTPALDVPSVVKLALQQSITAARYQLETDISIKGLPPETASMLGISNPNQELSLMNIAASIEGKNKTMAIKGIYVAMAGLTADQELIFAKADDKSYIHGPLPLIGAPKDDWYALDASSSGTSFGQMLDTTFGDSTDINALANGDFSLLRALGKETLHSQQCDVYGTTDIKVVAQVFQSSANAAMTPSDLDSFDAAELKFWVCADGYFHQMRVSFDGISDAQSPQESSLYARVTMSNFNGNFHVYAPTNALELEQTTTSGTVFERLPSTGALASSGHTATVFNGGNIRSAPHKEGQVLGQLQANQSVALVKQTIDGRWFYVSAPEATGWVHVSLLHIPTGVAGKVFIDGEARLTSAASETLSAAVVHGGNRRAGPNTKAEVLGQVRNGETIQLLAKTKDGSWYYARCRCGALGWVHASLLKIEPKVARLIPVA